MTVSLAQLQEWMDAREDAHLEFKEAANNYNFEKLVEYCAAFANERGGVMVFGVTDRPPRRVVGSQAFLNLEQVKLDLLGRLHLRIDAEEMHHPDGRIVAFIIPSRPIGTPIQYKGAYLMRVGESLVSMTADQLRNIFSEAVVDFSAEICSAATMADLDVEAIERFREMWRRKSGNEALDRLTIEQLLTDAELIVDDGVTFAALILLGTRQALGRHLAQAEVVFEYRSSEASVSYQQREEYRQGFLLFHDDLWNTINLRNEVQEFSDGLFIGQTPTFNERVVREAVLNAVSHRDYQHPGSVFIKQYPRKLEIVSPGGFPPGISPENILWRQLPRNRRIAEALVRCGLVERSGQGANRIVEGCIKESKALPEFTGTDAHQVDVTFHGDVQDPSFLLFLNRVGRERVAAFTTQDWLVLDSTRRDQPIADDLQANLSELLREGLVEKAGRGRGVHYVLGRDFRDDAKAKQPGDSARKSSRAGIKNALLKRIADSGETGIALGDLIQEFPRLTRNQIQKLLQELRDEARVHSVGVTKGVRWFAEE